MTKKKRTKKSPIVKFIEKAIFGFLISLLAASFYWVGEKSTEFRVPQSGQAAELYANQTDDNLRMVFGKAIDSAKNSVLLIIYTLTDPTLINKLNEKAAQGVAVTIIADPEKFYKLAQKLRPEIHLVERRTKGGIMHLKILSIDDRKIWLGSSNMTKGSLRMHGNLVSSFDCPEMARIIREHALHLENGAPRPSSPTVYDMGGQKVELYFLPDTYHALARLTKLMAEAEKTIRIAMFAWTRNDLAHELEKARKRGVDVKIVIDQTLGTGAGLDIVKLLQRSGFPVRLSQGKGLLHHKFMYIDGKKLVNGSANWTGNAFSKNDDCFVVIDELTEDQKKQMEKVWKVIWHESQPSEKIIGSL